MMKLYICPDCQELRLASRRAEVACPRCGKQKLPLTRLTFLEYSEMSDEKRQEYARIQAKKIKKKGVREEAEDD